ncbi:MAG: hypothetical protein H0W13_02915 [Nitrospirales bacterium]|nr:hypothetical protein [Nitrospirales bacterium]
MLHRATQISARFTRWRLAIFLVGAAASVTLFQQQWYQFGNMALAGFLLLFIIVARYHSKLEDRIQRLRAWRRIKATHLARLRLDWTGIPARATPALEQHPYAVDLDLVGPHSLLVLLDTTNSSNGRERLGEWLLTQPTDAMHWDNRQTLIKELARLPLFRDRLALEASLLGEAELNGDRVYSALAPPVGFPRLIPLLLIQAMLAGITLSLTFASAVTGFREYWILSFTGYAAIYLLTSGQVEPVFGRALSLHGQLEKLGGLFRYLERRSYAATPALGRLCAAVVAGVARPSIAIRRLARVSHALSVRAHPLVHLALNGIVPWDLFFTWRLERIRGHVLKDVSVWLETLAELEASNALAAFAFLHPEYHWPVPLTAEPSTNGGRTAVLTATALGHPLIPSARRVTNDLEMRGLGRVLLVTGSNMSGKSTFLRTVGINACLAQAGAPVCARSFEWTWARMACCIRVDDSLEAGLSFFYAEVKRLKRLLDAAEDRAAPPVLFLIDEIFKGTNNRERLIGSRAYIQALTTSHGLGLVTTHDLELAEMECTFPTLTNAHFQETVQANQLKFDYLLRPGPCPTTNALRIMALEGLPVTDLMPNDSPGSIREG